MSDWVDNQGEQPRKTRGERVRVQLRGEGDEPYEPIYPSDRDPMAKPGWPADKPTRWTFSADDDPCRRFDIMRWRLLA